MDSELDIVPVLCLQKILKAVIAQTFPLSERSNSANVKRSWYFKARNVENIQGIWLETWKAGSKEKHTLLIASTVRENRHRQMPQE